jgi:hypothetical protein
LDTPCAFEHGNGVGLDENVNTGSITIYIGGLNVPFKKVFMSTNAALNLNPPDIYGYNHGLYIMYISIRACIMIEKVAHLLLSLY